jgi:multidrug efflux system membrane fusion protein
MLNSRLFFLFLSLYLFGCEKKTIPKAYVARVEVEKVITQTIPIGLKAIGHCTAFNSAEIKAQVEGVLEKIHFNEGDQVEEGQLLITIDPRPYAAELDKAVAIRAENLAALLYSAEVVSRYETLLKNDYVSVLDFENYVKELAQNEALVMQNDADIRLAEINLGYCFIKAPYSGIAGKKLVDEGNLITNNGTSVVVINQVNPIFIDFFLPERDFSGIMKYRQGNNPLKVDISVPGEAKLREARLILVDNTINGQTGMVPLRAQIDNEDDFFWPGQYVESTLILKQEENALLVPSKAITSGSKGRYVYVIGEDGKALYKAVKEFDIYGEYTHVIADLNPGDTVVTRGQINVTPGVMCEIITKDQSK